MRAGKALPTPSLRNMNKRKVDIAKALRAKLTASEKPGASKDYQSIKLDKDDISPTSRRSSSCLMTWRTKAFGSSLLKPRFWIPHKINMKQKITLSVLAFALSVSWTKRYRDSRQGHKRWQRRWRRVRLRSRYGKPQSLGRLYRSRRQLCHR